uniref:(northern house mosquito) hypothetical protein n=1 Tax=Culex pipiens TaxID=7175 RepID=A0A8D8BJW6_CULPI
MAVRKPQNLNRITTQLNHKEQKLPRQNPVEVHMKELHTNVIPLTPNHYVQHPVKHLLDLQLFNGADFGTYAKVDLPQPFGRVEQHPVPRATYQGGVFAITQLADVVQDVPD